MVTVYDKMILSLSLKAIQYKQLKFNLTAHLLYQGAQSKKKKNEEGFLCVFQSQLNSGVECRRSEVLRLVFFFFFFFLFCVCGRRGYLPCLAS